MRRNREKTATVVGSWYNPPPSTISYIRPADWLVLPNIGATDQKFVGLYAVDNNHSNFASILAAGNYTVDWGDGTAKENVLSGNKIDHLYDYSSISVATTCSRGYRQVIITITPQAGQTLTSINLNQRHASDNQQYCTNWLDIKCAGSSMTALTLSGANVHNRWLEQFEWVGTNSFTTCVSMFVNCWQLQRVVSLYTNGVSNFGQMFDGCRALRDLPVLNTSACTSTFAYMFRNCKSLLTIPLIDTSNATTFTEMFSYCDSLRTIPALNLVKATGCAYMFYECPCLEFVPSLNLTACLNISQMFLDCYNLKSINFSSFAATTVDSVFYNCTSLRSAVITGLNQTFSYVNCELAREELVDIFNGLATVSGKTLTITGNWGVAGLSVAEKAIATDKGWALTL